MQLSTKSNVLLIDQSTIMNWTELKFKMHKNHIYFNVILYSFLFFFWKSIPFTNKYIKKKILKFATSLNVYVYNRLINYKWLTNTRFYKSESSINWLYLSHWPSLLLSPQLELNLDVEQISLTALISYFKSYCLFLWFYCEIIRSLFISWAVRVGIFPCGPFRKEWT